jgi:methylated-DNA-protein-cysteine methyltransferase-like protein
MRPLRTTFGRSADAPGTLTESPRAREILRKIRSVPPGFVTTYGDLCPEAPRYAGAILAACEDPSVPWHRVVRADGSLAKGARQRRLLVREGVPLRNGRVDMRAAWVDVASLSSAQPALG